MALRYNGVDVPSFVIVRGVKVSLLPPISPVTVSVRGRAGSYRFGDDLGNRQITVDYTICADSPADLRVKARQFANWFYSTEPKPLVLAEEPDKHYLAQVSEETDLDELLGIGQGSITFLCTDPFVYGAEKSQPLFMNGRSVVTLVEDPLDTDFDGDGVADGWTKGTSSGATAVFSIEDGAQKIDVTATAAGTLYTSANRSGIPVAAGRTYDFVVDYRTGNITGTGRVNIVIDWRDSTNTNLGYANSPYVTTNVSGWSTLTYTTTAPVNAVSATIKLQVVTGAAGDRATAWFRNVRFYEEESSIETVPVTVVNNGGATAYPVIEMEFTEDVTDVLVQGSKGALYFGEPPVIFDQTAAKTKIKLLDDTCSSFTGWTSGVAIDGGTIAGSFTSDGSYIRVSDYGSGSNWHGPAAVKSLNKQVQDFTFQAHLYFDASAHNQMGRVEFYFLDPNNARVAKLALKDINKTYESPWFEARAGQSSNGHFFMNSDYSRGSYANFYGRLFLQRIGNKWSAQIGRYNSKTREYYGRWSGQYIDTAYKYMDKIAAIQIHIGVPSDKPVVSNMAIDRIEFWEENAVDPQTQVPYVFEAGDHLKIDCERGLILKNGEPAFEHLYPSSSFIELLPGPNAIRVSPAAVTHGLIRFKERWL